MDLNIETMSAIQTAAEAVMKSPDQPVAIKTRAKALRQAAIRMRIELEARKLRSESTAELFG